MTILAHFFSHKIRNCMFIATNQSCSMAGLVYVEDQTLHRVRVQHVTYQLKTIKKNNLWRSGC